MGHSPGVSLELSTDPEDDGRRLEVVLRRQVERATGLPLSKAEARRLLGEGRALLNGRVVRRASHRVEAGQTLSVDLRREALEARQEERRARVALGPEALLLERGALLAIDKPAGLPSHPTPDPARDSAVQAAGRLLAAAGEPPVPLWLCHRLDAATSGVLLLARDAETARAMGEAFAARRVEKRYDALVHVERAQPPDAWTVEGYLATRGGQSASVHSGGAPTRTDFLIRERLAAAAHVEARPHTGRTHQIRVHLAEGGTPILGDRRYGAGETDGAERLMLHARALRFEDPRSAEHIEVEASMPAEMQRCILTRRTRPPDPGPPRS